MCWEDLEISLGLDELRISQDMWTISKIVGICFVVLRNTLLWTPIVEVVWKKAWWKHVSSGYILFDWPLFATLRSKHFACHTLSEPDELAVMYINRLNRFMVLTL